MESCGEAAIPLMIGWWNETSGWWAVTLEFIRQVSPAKPLGAGVAIRTRLMIAGMI